MTLPFLRFSVNGVYTVDPVFTTGGTATFEWISPDGSISTGTTPNPVLDQAGNYVVKCSDWSDVTKFTFDNDGVTAIDNLAVLAPSLTELYCQNNACAFTTLDVTPLLKLQKLVTYGTGIYALDVKNLTELVHLICWDMELSELDVSTLTSLTILECNDNDIQNLEVSALTSLTKLYCFNNAMNEASIDSILADLVTAGAINGTANLAGNTAPSAAGLVDKATLVARGWVVTTD